MQLVECCFEQFCWSDNEHYSCLIMKLKKNSNAIIKFRSIFSKLQCQTIALMCFCYCWIWFHISWSQTSFDTSIWFYSLIKSKMKIKIILAQIGALNKINTESASFLTKIEAIATKHQLTLKNLSIICK